MAKTRFINDSGLTARMTLVLFLLGGLFVALIVGLMYALPQYAILIGIVGLGIAWWQWFNSDKLALRAMQARPVTPQEAPELHGMIDRLCALADMPKPKVHIAYTDMPNAFATGRSPERSAVCVTTGILDRLTPEEMEGVLAHELSHVAHRDVLVMTLASSAGIIAGQLRQRWTRSVPVQATTPTALSSSRPILAGPSRKSFIGHVLDAEVTDRVEGTAGAVAWLAGNGAHVVRVHDVREMVRVVRMVDAIRHA